MVTENTPTILIVEDQPMQRGLLVEALTSAGYAVKEAWNGEDAIMMVSGLRTLGRRLDLIILDMKLPFGDGRDVLRHLADQGNYVPVVAISAHEEMLAAAASGGAQATVAKPYDVAEIMAAVARYRPPPPA